MRTRIAAAVVFFLLTGLAAVAHADLDIFISNLNVQAQADLPGFKAKLSAQFGVPLPKVEAIIAQVKLPGDAFMCLELGRMARKPPETVVQTYQRGKGKGWGVLAKELGIKPGSAEFHALKRGDLTFTGEPGRPGKEQGKGQGKQKGKGNKD